MHCKDISFDAYFQILENLLDDIGTQMVLFENVESLFNEFSKCEELIYIEANLRLSERIMRPLSSLRVIPRYKEGSDKESIFDLMEIHFSVKGAIAATKKIISGGLFTREIVINLVVPSLFRFVELFIDDFKTENEWYRDHPHESDWSQVIDVLQILIKVIENEGERYPESWLKEDIAPSFVSLFRSGSPLLLKKDIKKPLAGHFFRLSTLLPVERVNFELVPLYKELVEDAFPDVHYTLLRDLSGFFQFVFPPIREELADVFKNLMPVDNDAKSWRLRAEFANQLTSILPLYRIEQIDRYFTPFALTFCADRIAVVRNAGISMLGQILVRFIKTEWKLSEYMNESHQCDCNQRQLLNEEGKEDLSNSSQVDNCDNKPLPLTSDLPLTNSLLREIRAGFLCTRSWRRRQSFGRLLYTLLQHSLLEETQFCHIFGSDLLLISKDDIANARQYFCLLTQNFRLDSGINPDLFDTIKERLKEISLEDTDMEVRHQALIALGEMDKNTEIDLSDRKNRLQFQSSIVNDSASLHY